MDPSRVKFDPAAIARHSNKVEVDSRYRADAVVVRKKRPALDNLVTGLKEEKGVTERKETKSTTKIPPTKRTYNDIANTKTSDTIFSLPSFKKQKTEVSKNETPIKKASGTTITNKPTNLKHTTPAKSTPTLSKPSTITSRPASNGVGAKPSYASVTSKPSSSTNNKPLKPPTTLAGGSKGLGSKPQAPTLAGSKGLSKAPLPSSSSSKAHAKPAPAPINKNPITKSPATLSGFPTKAPPPSKSGQPPLKNTTLQTLPNRAAGAPGSKMPPPKVQNGVKLQQRPRHVVYNEYELDPIADGEELGEEENYWNSNYSSAIRDIFKRKHKYAPIQYSDEEDDIKETGFLDWEEEEQRSEAAGEREDRAEFMSEKKRKLAKQKKKMQDKTKL